MFDILARCNLSTVYRGVLVHDWLDLFRPSRQQPTFIMLSTRFRKLPYEIVEAILLVCANDWHVQAPAALSRLCRVSKAMCQVCTPLLYSIIIIPSGRQALQYTRTNQSRPVSFISTHLRSLSLSIAADESPTLAHEALKPLARVIGVAQYAQAPLDTISRALDAFCWQHSTGAPDGGPSMPNLHISILPPNPAEPIDVEAIMRRLVLNANVSKLHIGGLSAFFHVLGYVGIVDVLAREQRHANAKTKGAAMMVLTHVSCDAHSWKEWEPRKTALTVVLLLQLVGLRRVVFRIPRLNGHFEPFVKELAQIRDPRVYIHVSDNSGMLSMGEVAVAGWRNHMAKLEDLWMSGDPVINIDAT